MRKKTGRSVTFVNMLKKGFRHADFLAKFARIPFINKNLQKGVKHDEMIFLTRDRVISVNQKIDEPENLILPSEIAEYFVNKTDYHWIMNFCICRDSLHCKNYPSDVGCLFMGEPVLGINPQFGRRVTKKEALEHLKKCREMGLVHVIGRNDLDAKWLGVGPGRKLFTICNCCPCCCITRYASELKFISDTLKKLPGIEVKVTDKCIGCGTCTEGTCFINAIQIVNERAKISKNCKGCGQCVEICPQNAIELTMNDEEFVEKSIKRLESIVDLT